MSDHAICRLCGGDAGSLLDDGVHSVCAARAARGLSTPCLGHRCPTCDGLGHRAPASATIDLHLADGPEAPLRALDAAFPACPDCAGTGSVPHADALDGARCACCGHHAGCCDCHIIDHPTDGPGCLTHRQEV